MLDAIGAYTTRINDTESDYARDVARYGQNAMNNRLSLARNVIQQEATAQRAIQHQATMGATWYRIRMDEQKQLDDQMDAAMKFAWEQELQTARFGLEDRRTTATEQQAGAAWARVGVDIAKAYTEEDQFNVSREDALRKEVTGARKNLQELLARTSNNLGTLTQQGVGHEIDIAKSAPPNTQYAPGYEPGGPYATLAGATGFNYNPDDWLTSNFTSAPINPYRGAMVAAPGMDRAIGLAQGAETDIVNRFNAQPQPRRTPFDTLVPGMMEMGLSPYSGLAGMGTIDEIVRAQEAAASFYEDEEDEE
jgi:hypothetical protein